MANEDKATRYHRLRRRADILAAVVTTAVLAGFLVSGASAAFRERITTVTGSSGVLAVIGYVVALAILLELIGLPLAFYRGVTLERRYGLSTQTTRRWWIDRIKAGVISTVFVVCGALIVMGLLRWDDERWWIYAAAAFVLLLVLVAQLAPVMLLPLFYEIKPLTREPLRERLLALATKAGATVVDVFEWRLSDRTKKANAVLAGIGRTRRVLLSDTLLADHSDEEVEVILAHELGHHVHRDLWSAMVTEAVLIVLGFYLANLTLESVGMRFGLQGKGDLAGLPLLVLSGGAVSLAFVPIANALSRAHERRADRFALRITGNPPAFITAMRRLAAQNLAEEEPSRLVQWLFHTHPPTSARIAAAQQYLPPAR